jgi:hypothetical protein
MLNTVCTNNHSPTDPTASPTIGQIPEQPTNHMFCAPDIMRVAESCELHI